MPDKGEAHLLRVCLLVLTGGVIAVVVSMPNEKTLTELACVCVLIGCLCCGGCQIYDIYAQLTPAAATAST
jgi:hypothetical protein